MSDFDPDAYLAAKAAPAAFDPDAYLASKTGPVENQHDFLPAMKNAASGAWDMAKGAAAGAVNKVLHPVDTAVDAYNTVKDVATDPLGDVEAVGRAARGVPILGQGIEEAAAAGSALMGDKPFAEGRKDFLKNLAASDAQHAKDRPLADLAQKGAIYSVPGANAVAINPLVQAADAGLRSYRSGNSLEDSLKDARNMGVLTGVAVKGAPLVGKAVAGAADEVGTAARSLGRGFKEGGKAAAESGSHIPFVQAGETLVGAVKGAIDEIKQQAASTQEFKQVAQQAMKVLRPGENGSIGNMSADEAVLAALMQDGENPVKQWFAHKSTMVNPGARASEDYSKLLNMGSDTRTAARAFDARATARDLVPDVENAQNLFKKARGERFNQLTQEARQTFEPSSVGGVLEELSGAAEDAQHPIINSKARNAIEGAKRMIEEGKGLRTHGLNVGALDEVPHEEVFNRLQTARKVIDSNLDWSSAQGDTESAKLLKGVRDKIDAALKTSPEKVEADGLYSASKNVEDNFFKATEFRNGGKVDIDESKIRKLFGDNDGAHRFRQTLDEVKAYAESPGLSPESKQAALDVVKKMEAKFEVADNKRIIDRFQAKGGPSSAAIERLQSAAGKNSLIADAANAPAGFLNQADEFNKFVQSKTGVTFPKLPPEKQIPVTKFWTWLKNNQDATQAQVDKAWTKLVGQ